MITIEIIISILILFMVITTSVTTIKQLRLIKEKSEKYELLYIAFFNISNLIDETICQIEHLEEIGEFSGVKYRARCNLVEKKRNYQEAMDIDSPKGNIGNIMILLYQVTLQITVKNSEKSYNYYKIIKRRVE